MSRSRFFEQFKRCVGAPPQHYIDLVRIRLAVQAIGASDGPLISVSEALGFKEPCHFSRFFTQHVGVSPSEFRRHLVRLG
jgi:AraC-like DNA-binding protein